MRGSWRRECRDLTACPCSTSYRSSAEGSERYAWDVVGKDNDIGTGNFQHRRLLAMFGMPIGELWSLDALADDCARDGVYELFLVTKPLNLTRGVGSLPNATAFK